MRRDLLDQLAAVAGPGAAIEPRRAVGRGLARVLAGPGRQHAARCAIRAVGVSGAAHRACACAGEPGAARRRGAVAARALARGPESVAGIAIAGDQKQGKRDSGSQHASSWGPICSPVKTPRRGEPQEPDAWR